MGYGDLKDRVRTTDGESSAALELQIVQSPRCESKREHFSATIKDEIT
jgi:hypothetical protein